MEDNETKITWVGQIVEISKDLNLDTLAAGYLIELYYLCQAYGLKLVYAPQDHAPDMFKIRRDNTNGSGIACVFASNGTTVAVPLLKLIGRKTTQLDQLEQRITALERKAGANDNAAQASGTTSDTTQARISDEKFTSLMARARDIGNFLENTGGRIKYHRHWRYAISPDGTKKSYFTVQDALMEWPHSSPYWYFKPDDSYELSRLEKFIEHDEKLYQIMQEKRSKEEK